MINLKFSLGHVQQNSIVNIPSKINLPNWVTHNKIQLNFVQLNYLKDHSQVLLDCTGAPENCWLLAFKYITDVHNVCANESLNYQIPRKLRHGGLQDISAFLEYHFYEPILYLDCDASFPSSKEKQGWWVGIANNVGDSLTFKTLTEDSNKMIHCSVVRPTLDDCFQKIFFALTLSLIPVSKPMMNLTIPVSLMADSNTRLTRDSPSIRNVSNYLLTT
jgi:hypothetical protein